jgi:ketosteroid isomerase-like protein
VNRFAVEREDIRELIERSSDAINHQDWSALEAMMTDDVVWERLAPTPWTLDGRAAVHGFLSGNSGRIDILYYAISASAIDVIDATHAVARSTMSELIRARETGSIVHVVGTYTDKFVVAGGRWLFARRTIAPRFERDLVGPARIISTTDGE